MAYKLEIIIPVYNPELEHFERMMKSLVDLDFTQTIITFVDDNSPSKDYLDIVSNYPIYYRLIQNKENLGCGRTREVAWRKNKEKWVFFLDQDDTIYARNINGIISLLDELYKDEMAVCTSVSIWNEHLQKDQTLSKDMGQCMGWIHGIFLNRHECLRRGIHFHNKINYGEDIYFSAQIKMHYVWENQMGKSLPEADVKTYKWYLWAGSTSHKEGENKYIEHYIDDCLQLYKDMIRMSVMISHNDQFFVCNYFMIEIITLYYQIMVDCQTEIFNAGYTQKVIEQNDNMCYLSSKAVNEIMEYLHLDKEFVLKNYFTECSNMVNQARHVSETTNHIYIVEYMSLKNWLELGEKGG